VAFGGVGKSALVAYWLDRMAADNWHGAARVLDWSFYSQGTKDQVTSAEPFIDYALRFFGDPDPQAGSPHDRGVRLALLIRKERSLLILDGVEPLVAPCSPTGLLKPLIFADLVGLTPDEAKKAVLTAVADGRPGKPATAPAFPGSSQPAAPAASGPAPAFPAAPSGALALWKEKLEFLEEQEAIAVDPAQKFALRKQIEEAKAKIREHGR
jgi:hypothetical protein